MTEVFGFTGTRKGMTAAQRKAVRGILQFARELHHGDCIGADADAHMAAQLVNETRKQERLHAYREHGLGSSTWHETPQITIHIHPPDDDTFQAHMKGHLVHTPKPYLDRNRDIVMAIPQDGKLIATPKEMFHLERTPSSWMNFTARYRRSGTWYTVRYALEQDKTVVIVWPDGMIEEVTLHEAG